MNDLTKRLDNIAEVLVESKDYSQFCHAIYEASFEIVRLRELVAAGDRLREAVYQAAKNPTALFHHLQTAIAEYDALTNPPKP